ncbi:hypothetical protein M422DRAFT_151982 [Sphaerobolus stellatus SS14]|nr:hypothetical protein M422DRAFT_151982 [Sphaerobolus stellatus SS14]
MADSAPTFLGFDLSTQSLKAIVLSPGLNLVHEEAITFDKDLPHYQTTGGAIRGSNGEVTSPVAMWLEALDLVIARMKEKGVDFGRVRGVSGAGQQHGSVYWSEEGVARLGSLDPEHALKDQLSPEGFTLQNSPIWQDSSTTKECIVLQEKVGGEQKLADISGSRAYERFTGPQIAKLRATRPEVYAATARISLVSSFAASLFLGKIAPIEVSDASGMNLMNVLTLKWEDELLEACGGPELKAKLGEEIAPGGTNLGKVSEWWVKKWGFSEECIVAPWTGDNPASVTGLSTPGDAILSLGTSTTFLISIPAADTPPQRLTTSHLLTHPTQTSPPGHIAMLCYKNGALAREEVRNRFSSKSWDEFNKQFESIPPGSDGYTGFYFPLLEIIPPNIQGEFIFKDGKPVSANSIPPSHHARAILESQFLSIKRRIKVIMPSDAAPLKRLIITGGTSANPVIRQFAADLFGMDVYTAETKESAGVGGALLAQFAWWRANVRPDGSFEEMKREAGERLDLVAKPNEEVTKVYEGLVEVYGKCEDWVVESEGKKAASESA